MSDPPMFVLVTTGPVSEVVTRGDWIDRTTHPWTEGPWDSEPDKVVWVDSFTDLDCMIVRNHSGAWCGYVGVPPGHRWHGKRYQDIDYDLDPDLDVHGGLTFTAGCEPDTPLCHTPVAGRPDDIWWLGFDCHHYLDRAPAWKPSSAPSGVTRSLRTGTASATSTPRAGPPTSPCPTPWPRSFASPSKSTRRPREPREPP